MKKMAFLAPVAVVTMMSVEAMAGVTVTAADANVYETTVAGATTVNFNDYNGTTNPEPAGYDSYTSVGAGFQFVNTTVSGQHAIPYAEGGEYDFGYYLSVPDGVGNSSTFGSAVLGLDAAYDYFGLFWGSIDGAGNPWTDNAIDFYLNGTLVASFDGDFIASTLYAPPGEADGGQTDWMSNRYINFFFTDGLLFDEVALSSTGYAFESDNHAYGNMAVPAPAALALFAVGLAGLGFSRRRK